MKSGVSFLALLISTAIVVGAGSPAPVLLKREGVFHRPKPGNELKRFDIAVPGGRSFHRIIVEVEVTHGGWNARGEKKTNHAVFWLNRGKKWRGNVLGYVNVFGPTRPRVKMANNIGKPPGVMSSQTRNWKAVPGHTYRFRYVYDAGAGRVDLTVSENGRQVAELRDQITTDPVTAKPHNDPAPPGFFIIFGHPADSPGPEVPTHGWTYANLKVLFQAPAVIP